MLRAVLCVYAGMESQVFCDALLPLFVGGIERQRLLRKQASLPAELFKKSLRPPARCYLGREEHGAAVQVALSVSTVDLNEGAVLADDARLPSLSTWDHLKLRYFDPQVA